MDQELEDLLQDLDIPESYGVDRGFVLHAQPPLSELEVVAIDFEGKPFILTRATATAWRELQSAATRDGVEILPFSGFRSYKYQAGLIRRHLERGRPLDDVLTSLAAPGYSEHHTGRAVDVTDRVVEPLVEAFDKTQAFEWLTKRADEFGFVMSYPADNQHGLIYEPWHWAYHS